MENALQQTQVRAAVASRNCQPYDQTHHGLGPPSPHLLVANSRNQPAGADPQHHDSPATIGFRHGRPDTFSSSSTVPTVAYACGDRTLQSQLGTANAAATGQAHADAGPLADDTVDWDRVATAGRQMWQAWTRRSATDPSSTGEGLASDSCWVLSEAQSLATTVEVFQSLP